MSKKKSEKIKARLEKKKEEKKKKALEKKKAKGESKQTKNKISEIIDSVNDIAAIAKIVASKFFKRLKIKIARLHITVATADAASTAIAYGAVCQAVSYLVAIFENSKNVSGLSRKNINITTDFLSDTPKADIKISFSFRVWHLLEIGISALVQHIKNKLKSQNKKRKQTS